MKISVIMAACNQSTYLANTVKSAVRGLQGCQDWEIIIIDDHSTDGCCDAIEQTDNIKVHRPDKKLGVSHARHLAGEMASGDVIVTTDTHCIYPKRSIWRMASHWAMQNRAVIVPTVSMEQDDGSKRIQYGHLGISRRGLRINRSSNPADKPCMFGGMYLMRRDVWDWLGGWIRLPGYWAGEEQIMSILAYRFGVPILVADNHTWEHLRYRRHGEYPYILPQEHPAEIASYIHASCFPETYNKYWKPLLYNYYRHEMKSDPSGLIEWINRRSLYSEQWFIETVLGRANLDEHPIFRSLLASQ